MRKSQQEKKLLLQKLSNKMTKENPKSEPTLKTLTLNILFDTRIKNKPPGFLQKFHIKFSEERFSYIVSKIQQMDPDVITFNQVTIRFLEFIEKSEFLSKHYLKSSSNYNPTTKYDVQGNLILVKNKFKNIQMSKIQLKSHHQPVHFASFEFNGKKIAVASVHLLAFKGNVKEREQQLQEILRYFDLEQNQLKAQVLILQGDMNFHSQKQNQISEKLQLKDCWLQKYDLTNYPGYTFDAEKNLMINQLYWGFEQRRMRLDRIFVKSHKPNSYQVKGIGIVFNKLIYGLNLEEQKTQFMGWLQSMGSFLGDLIGKNFFRNKEKYLFPSDHFGLMAQFLIL